MVKWKLVYTRQALKDAKKINVAGLKIRTEKPLKILEIDSYK